MWMSRDLGPVVGLLKLLKAFNTCRRLSCHSGRVRKIVGVLNFFLRTIKLRKVILTFSRTKLIDYDVVRVHIDSVPIRSGFQTPLCSMSSHQ